MHAVDCGKCTQWIAFQSFLIKSKLESIHKSYVQETDLCFFIICSLIHDYVADTCGTAWVVGPCICDMVFYFLRSGVQNSEFSKNAQGNCVYFRRHCTVTAFFFYRTVKSATITREELVK
jgi:hypothetical protein